MRTLGIDFGEKRIGLAISDSQGRIAVPLMTVARETDRRAVYQLAALANTENVEHLVIGEPRSIADGGDNEACQRIRRFGAKLAKASKLHITYVDETLTTVEAAARLQLVGNDSIERRDALAAQILLQEVLDQQSESLQSEISIAKVPISESL